jgi:ABC-type transporter Mla subunit MlaD
MHRTLKLVTLVVALCALVVPGSAVAASKQDRGVTRSVASALRSADRALDRSEVKLEDGASATKSLASVKRHFARALKAATAAAAADSDTSDRNWERYIDASDDALEILADLSDTYGDGSGDIAATVTSITEGRAAAVTAAGTSTDDSSTAGVSDTSGDRGDCPGGRSGRASRGQDDTTTAPATGTGNGQV